ncbi:ROK family protein [Rhodococcus sp. NPDC049939]|uniref:ROK family protein n=1 Tax=Rhodococcus sp. NPDC049939 TaxID=3155511 RepID=UPI0033E01C5D
MVALALDIGGTKIAAGVAEADGTVPRPATTPTPRSGVWDACAALLREVVGSAPVTSVGIASAGPVDAAAGMVWPINIDEWSGGFELAGAVQTLFPGASTQLALDGAAAALGEYHHGAGRGTPDLLSLVVSTGIGGGVVLGGHITAGRTGNAGHIGHIVVPGGTDPCTCGGIGCLETVASGPSSVRWARANGWRGSTGVELAKAAASGDAVALAALDRAGTALGQAIASAAAIIDVDLAVIGGGFAHAGPPLWDPLRGAAERHARLSFVSNLRVVPAQLGASGTLVGAGGLAVYGS